MIKTSEEFHKIVNSNVRQFSGYFRIGDKIVSSDDNLISIGFSDDIYADGFVGTFIAKTVKVKLYNKERFNYENQEIDVFIGLNIGETFEYVILGKYMVYELTNEKTTNITTLSCMDYVMKYQKPIDVQILTFPSTINELVEQISSICEVEVDEGNNYPNMDFEFATQPYINSEWQYRDLIMGLVEACGCYAKINRQNKLIVKTLSVWEESIPDIKFDEDIYKSFSAEDRFGYINSIVIAREPQNDNIYLRDEESIEYNGLTELKIVNNTFIDSYREIAIQPIFNAYNWVTYVPFEMKPIGDPRYESGDIVKISNFNRETNEVQTYISVIMQQSFTYNGGLAQTIKAIALTKTEINYDYAASIDRRLTNTEIIVDKQQNTITSVVEEVTLIGIPIGLEPPTEPRNEDYWLDTSTNIVMQFNGLEWLPTSHDPNKIKDLVTIEKLGTELQQTKEEFNFTINSKGNLNILKNSVGKNSINFWEVKGNPEVLNTSKLANDTVSSSAFYLANSEMRQEINVNIGVTYSYTGRIATGSYPVSIQIDNGGTLEDVFTFKPFNDVEEVHYKFEASTNKITVIFTAYDLAEDQATYLMVSDSVISEGSNRMKWIPYVDELYTTNVKIDNDGITVGNNYTDIQSKITNQAFDIMRGQNEPAISVNMLQTKLQKTVIEDDLTVGKMKMIVRDKRVDIIMID